VDVKPRQGIVEVEVTRGGRRESVHAVAWALAAADDRPADGTAAGLPDVFPRSAVKPFQAMPVIETGAADRFGVSAAELALAAASHSGGPDHVAGVRRVEHMRWWSYHHSGA
jgi:L-asparaginase II